MTRGTRGIRTGCGAVLALLTLVGCAQSGQTAQQTTQAVAADPVQAAANAAGSVVNAATGAVNGAVNGAVAGAGAQSAKPRPRAKPNGRGGFDSSELQRDTIRRSHMVSARYGVTKTTRARNGILAGSPTTRQTTASSTR